MSAFLAQAGTGAANTGDDAYLLWGFLLLGAAIILVFIELFIPSGGLIGILAGIATIGSVISFFRYDTTWGIVSASSYVIFAPIVGVFVFKLWLNSPIARGMILGGEDPNATTTDEDSVRVSEQTRMKKLEELRQLIGAEGVTVTPLRPVGTVKINDQRIDAMAEAGTIDAGAAVVVTDIYDNQIKVREK